MICIIGLGNPGTSYARSRHNTGWKVIDALAHAVEPNGVFEREKALEAETLKYNQSIFVKPLTFMNLSGNAVKAVLKKYDYGSLGKRDFRNVFVVYDDLDIEVGKYKLVFGSGPKVHNGVNNIRDVLGTDQFWHVRIGVDGRKGDRSSDPQEYVLSGFSLQEQELLDRVIDGVVDLLRTKISPTT